MSSRSGLQDLVSLNRVDTGGLFSATLRCRQLAYLRYVALLRLVLQKIASPLSCRFKTDKALAG
ncbi:hypothetical protein SAMN02745170_02511 [Propionispora hippei DSM 15287]|uniref:Uncharacterized protein n=1 Tax=Propionispora hippei DSM 15287 TaxID=1123003 RepID=A0A1M6J7D2_9FIRM|nr:hypothetical protein SAMN02745170_02511 [Propionispora hippei DSM 15287]